MSKRVVLLLDLWNGLTPMISLALSSGSLKTKKPTALVVGASFSPNKVLRGINFFLCEKELSRGPVKTREAGLRMGLKVVQTLKLGVKVKCYGGFFC